MTMLREWIARFRGTLRPRRSDRDLEEELRLHLEMAAEEARGAGESPESAARSAAVRLGGSAQAMEALRDQRGLPWLADLGRDVRYGLRGLARNRSFSLVAILSLALGIGANTAIFSVINAVMLRKLPVRAPEELVEFLTQYPGDPRLNYFGSDYYQNIRERNRVFAEVIGFSRTQVDVGSGDRNAEPVEAGYVVGSFFDALGLQPAIGRLLEPHDDTPSAETVAVVSWSYWRDRFGLDPSVVGERIAVNGVPAVVVGVTRREFTGLMVGFETHVWMPVAMASRVQPVRRVGTLPANVQTPLMLSLIARLKPGVSMAQAQAEMRVLDQPRIEAAASRDPLWREAVLQLEPAGAGLSALRDRVRTPLLVLMGIVALLLLIACTNNASLLLARGAARRRELAVRVALGAGRLRLARQALTEALLLSTTGALLGVVVGYAGVGALLRIFGSGTTPMFGVPLNIQVEPDLNVLLFTVGVALITGVLFGLAPVADAFAWDPAKSLRDRSTGSDRRSQRVYGRALVVAQVALSVVLLSAAALFIGQLSKLRNEGLGFERDSVLLVTLNPQGSGYGRAELSRRYQDLLKRLEAMPGITSATLSALTPIELGGAARFASVEGFQERPEERRRLRLNWVGPGYFRTLGTPVLAGREFAFEDAERPRVAIVNQTLARHYFDHQSPLGRHITFEYDDRPYEIVGVVGDAKYSSLHESAPRTMYLNAFQDGQIVSKFSVRTDGTPTALVANIRQVVRDVAGDVAVAKVTTLTDQIDASLVMERTIAALAGWFGAVGALLAAVGLYGLLTYTVARRRTEIGVRLALGATPRAITCMVLTGAAGLVGAGLVIGIPIAILGRRLAANIIGELPAATLPIGVAALGLLSVALLAALLPARRAASVAPVEVLGHE